MSQTLAKIVTYEEFIQWLPDNGKRYELHDGAIAEMPQPRGNHEKVVSFLTLELAMQIRGMRYPYLLPKTVPVIIEVVSTNWRDDYYKKVADYEEMKIPEYWIVDYAGLGGRNFLGFPKQPALFVCEFVDGEYVKTLFRSDTLIISPTFPHLDLTAQQIFDTEKM